MNINELKQNVKSLHDEDGWGLLDDLGFESIMGDRDWAACGHKWAMRMNVFSNILKDRYMVIEWCNAADHMSEPANEREYDYIVTISVVSLKEVPRDKVLSACRSCGYEDGWPEHAQVRKGAGVSDEDKLRVALARVEILHCYGTYAVLDETTYKDNKWEETDETSWEWDKEPTYERAGEFLLDAVERARPMPMLHGFMLDRQANAVGATGHDMMRGNPWGKLARHFKKAK